jgi:endonuclease/exonuclease/phosphatase family metal-dependent hydrolase
VKAQPDVLAQSVEKRRRPAWCDRILWRSGSPEAARLLTYASAQLTVSDHMPVTATFALQACEYDRRATLPALHPSLVRSLGVCIA